MNTETSWTELHALSVKAATGAGVPAGQALAFGAMLPRHLAEGRPQAPLADVLQTPKTIVSLAHQIETMIEEASVSPRLVQANVPDAGHCAILTSWIEGLPCQAEVVSTPEGVQAYLSLEAPSNRARPERISIGHDLLKLLNEFAARTYVPDSAESRANGAGADAMVLD
ncbi:hypothetical protein [Tateyamaria sp.]|uniref:hypothetical protein n=1 Tax=Tateyamaria sp. TaxID=1929288 RepID=UPI00329BBBD0